MRPDQNNEHGAALVLALVFVVLFGALTNSLVHGDRRIAATTVSERAIYSALHAAEGGISQARWQLRRDPTYAGETVRIGDAEVLIEVRNATSDADRRLVRAIARIGSQNGMERTAQRCIDAELRGVGDATKLPQITLWQHRR